MTTVGITVGHGSSMFLQVFFEAHGLSLLSRAGESSAPISMGL